MLALIIQIDKFKSRHWVSSDLPMFRDTRPQDLRESNSCPKLIEKCDTKGIADETRLCSNMAETEKQKCLVTGKSEQPRCVSNV